MTLHDSPWRCSIGQPFIYSAQISTTPPKAASREVNLEADRTFILDADHEGNADLGRRA